MKYINFKRFKLSTILKYIDLQRYNFYKIRKYIVLPRYNFSKVYKYFDLRRYNYSKVYKYFDLQRYNFSKIYRKINFYKFKNIPLYVIGAIVFSSFIYLSIPFFFNYEKLKVENEICKNINIECSTNSKISYSFFPSPRVNIQNLVIKDFVNKKRVLGKIENVAVKLPINNLLNRKKFIFTKLVLKKAEVNLNLNDLKKYYNFSKKNFKLKPMSLSKGNINFFEGKKYVASIKNVNLKYKSNEKKNETKIKGIFLDDNIYINFKNKKNDNPSKIFVLKLLEAKLLTKINIFNADTNESAVIGDISLKKGKDRLLANFKYKDNKITLIKGNLRNVFLNGNINGDIRFLPFFDFDLNVELGGINFHRLHSLLAGLDDISKRNLFKINNKINGHLNLSAEKIYSKYNLIDSFESRIRLVNGDILVEQLILNLGKLGAADINGLVSNSKKFSNLNFESNIFIDNQKYFFSKFGIYNRKSIPTNLFVAGNFNLSNLILRLEEISDDKKFENEDIIYVEKEFNDLLLENGYDSFFSYLKFKEFIRSVMDETIN